MKRTLLLTFSILLVVIALSILSQRSSTTATNHVNEPSIIDTTTIDATTPPTINKLLANLVPTARCQETFWGTYTDPCEGARSFCRGQQLMLMDLCIAMGKAKYVCYAEYNDWYRDCLMRSNCL